MLSRIFYFLRAAKNVVVVQFYPWIKFYFLLFQTHYHVLTYPKTLKKIKFKPRIKLNHNNFKMTVPLVCNFRSLSNKCPNNFLKFNFSHFTPQVRLFFCRKKET